MAAVSNVSRARSVRNDPPPRHHDAMSKWGRLVHEDPKKFYVFVNKESQDSLWHYETEGYEVETYRKGGVRPAGITQARADSMDGQEIEVRGMVLMSIDAEVRKRAELDGLAEADKILSRIRGPRAVRDLKTGVRTRGPSGKDVLDVENDIGPLEVQGE